MTDVRDRLNQLTAMVRDAKARPMSALSAVNRAEMLGLIEQLRADLPAHLDHSDALLSDRQTVLAATGEQAERILESARLEREHLIDQSDEAAQDTGSAGGGRPMEHGEPGVLDPAFG